MEKSSLNFSFRLQLGESSNDICWIEALGIVRVDVAESNSAIGVDDIGSSQGQLKGVIAVIGRQNLVSLSRIEF